MTFSIKLNLVKNIKKRKFKNSIFRAVREIIDDKLILKISKNFLMIKIYFIGPILTKFKELEKQNNIIFLG